MLFGTIEAGGTKFVLSVMNEERKILKRLEIATLSPNITLNKCVEFFKENPVRSLGIGFFGPVDLNEDSDTYGYVLKTPKPEWSNVEIVGFFREKLSIPIGFDTDVNAAGIAEHKLGAGLGFSDIIYLTVGTGIGGALIANHRIVHGYMHPEIGHSTLVRHPEDKDFECNCPFHDNCAEGLAAGPSIFKRFEIKGQDLPLDHIAWDIEAYYLGQLVSNLVLTCAPQKIILGGGVMHQTSLFAKINHYFKEFNNGYVESEYFNENYIVAPDLGDNAGITGAFLLAKSAFYKANKGL